jgi:hypothetical protein
MTELLDRRTSKRVPMSFLVRNIAEGGSYEEWEGNLSLGGIYFRGRYPPLGSEVEVRFRLKGVPKEIRARGEIIRVSSRDGGLDFHVRFTELDVPSENAVAAYIEAQTAGSSRSG